MRYNSLFDIIGPVMVGPSSSHTAGAVRIGRISRKIFGKKPDKVDIILYGSFAATYKGHGSDLAFVAGAIGFDTDDTRIPEALNIAKAEGIQINFSISTEPTNHPNTATLVFHSGEDKSSITGVSLGGGKITITGIDGFDVNFTGENPGFIAIHQDRYGVIYSVTKILKDYQINISHMEVFRKSKSETAIMTIETDGNVSQDILDKINNTPYIYKTIGVEF